MNGETVLYHYQALANLVGPEIASEFYDLMEAYGVLGDPDTTFLMEIRQGLEQNEVAQS